MHENFFACGAKLNFYSTSLIGALRYQDPSIILFHTDCEPSGPYWNAFKAIAGKRLKIVKRTAPAEVWGIDIKVKASWITVE